MGSLVAVLEKCQMLGDFLNRIRNFGCRIRNLLGGSDGCFFFFGTVSSSDAIINSRHSFHIADIQNGILSHLTRVGCSKDCGAAASPTLPPSPPRRERPATPIGLPKYGFLAERHPSELGPRRPDLCLAQQPVPRRPRHSALRDLSTATEALPTAVVARGGGVRVGSGVVRRRGHVSASRSEWRGALGAEVAAGVQQSTTRRWADVVASGHSPPSPSAPALPQAANTARSLQQVRTRPMRPPRRDGMGPRS